MTMPLVDPPVPVRPGAIRTWLLASRPATLLVGIVPVMVGTAVAYSLGSMRVGPAVAALLGTLLIQIGANFANDVFDFEKGADTHARLGPQRMTQAGFISPSAMRKGMITVFGLAMVAGGYLIRVAGLPVLAIGVVSIASAIAYTGGPWPLGYNGLGDVFVFIFFGVVAVVGTAFVQIGALSSLALIASIPVGALATAVLVVNNVRDYETDIAAGKRTLVARFGRTFGVAEYAVLLWAAYLVPAIMMVMIPGRFWTVLPMLSAPIAVRLLRSVVSDRGLDLNKTLAGTAKLLFVYGVLFSVGLIL